MNYYPKKGLNPKNSTSEDENKDDRVTGAAVAVAAATGVAALAWGLSKLLGSSEREPKRHEQMTLSSSSSSRGMRDRNRNENDNTFDHIIREASGRRINSGEEKYKWTRPKKNRLKLNTDASARKQHGEKTGPASAGGVIRDDEGQWIVGFSSNLGVRDSTDAELMAVRDGLRLAWTQEFMWVEVETDSEAVVKLINNHDLKNNYSRGLVVQECRDLLKKLGSEISHVYKEANRCAHTLAKIGVHQGSEEFESIPNDHVREAYKSDMQNSSPHYFLG